MTGFQNCAAERLAKLPSYLFVEIDRKKREAKIAGRDVIDFGVGDPDCPTPSFIIERMAQAIAEPASHRYSSSLGEITLREAFARFFQKRYGVSLDPQTEVLVLLGAKEGIAHLATAILNPGDVAMVPEPGYPVYESGTVLADGKCHTMALEAARQWLPDLGAISGEVRQSAKILWLNYPNNPTGAIAPLSFFEEAVTFAREYRILIAQDAAYNELYFEDPPPSILQVDGAKEVAVEFHSLSKTFNMTGWRIGFAVGNAQVLAALAKVKSNIDSGAFAAVQAAGVAALEGFERSEIVEQRKTYQRRRDLLVNGLRAAGWSVSTPKASIYLWVACPGDMTSNQLAGRLLDEADVVTIPGAGFGPAGEGYVRFALTVTEDRTREAVGRIANISW